MPDTAHKPSDPDLPDFNDAWRLFTDMHDNPSNAAAKALVEWLAQCPRHVKVFDYMLTLWALTGAGLVTRSNRSRLDAPTPLQ